MHNTLNNNLYKSNVSGNKNFINIMLFQGEPPADTSKRDDVDKIIQAKVKEIEQAKEAERLLLSEQVLTKADKKEKKRLEKQLSKERKRELHEARKQQKLEQKQKLLDERQGVKQPSTDTDKEKELWLKSQEEDARKNLAAIRESNTGNLPQDKKAEPTSPGIVFNTNSSGAGNAGTSANGGVSGTGGVSSTGVGTNLTNDTATSANTQPLTNINAISSIGNNASGNAGADNTLSAMPYSINSNGSATDSTLGGLQNTQNAFQQNTDTNAGQPLTTQTLPQPIIRHGYTGLDSDVFSRYIDEPVNTDFKIDLIAHSRVLADDTISLLRASASKNSSFAISSRVSAFKNKFLAITTPVCDSEYLFEITSTADRVWYQAVKLLLSVDEEYSRYIAIHSFLKHARKKSIEAEENIRVAENSLRQETDVAEISDLNSIIAFNNSLKRNFISRFNEFEQIAQRTKTKITNLLKRIEALLNRDVRLERDVLEKLRRYNVNSGVLERAEIRLSELIKELEQKNTVTYGAQTNIAESTIVANQNFIDNIEVKFAQILINLTKLENKICANIVEGIDSIIGLKPLGEALQKFFIEANTDALNKHLHLFDVRRRVFGEIANSNETIRKELLKVYEVQSRAEFEVLKAQQEIIHETEVAVREVNILKSQAAKIIEQTKNQDMDEYDVRQKLMRLDVNLKLAKANQKAAFEKSDKTKQEASELSQKMIDRALAEAEPVCNQQLALKVKHTQNLEELMVKIDDIARNNYQATELAIAEQLLKNAKTPQDFKIAQERLARIEDYSRKVESQLELERKFRQEEADVQIERLRSNLARANKEAEEMIALARDFSEESRSNAIKLTETARINAEKAWKQFDEAADDFKEIALLDAEEADKALEKAKADSQDIFDEAERVVEDAAKAASQLQLEAEMELQNAVDDLRAEFERLVSIEQSRAAFIEKKYEEINFEEITSETLSAEDEEYNNFVKVLRDIELEIDGVNTAEEAQMLAIKINSLRGNIPPKSHSEFSEALGILMDRLDNQKQMLILKKGLAGTFDAKPQKKLVKVTERITQKAKPKTITKQHTKTVNKSNTQIKRPPVPARPGMARPGAAGARPGAAGARPGMPARPGMAARPGAAGARPGMAKPGAAARPGASGARPGAAAARPGAAAARPAAKPAARPAARK
ncbi:MAG: hypothetical protein FWB72_02435 [Firmicutes bacterium]|nr:hypothetical protein [Bacillota bacterium]